MIAILPAFKIIYTKGLPEISADINNYDYIKDYEVSTVCYSSSKLLCLTSVAAVRILERITLASPSLL